MRETEVQLSIEVRGGEGRKSSTTEGGGNLHCQWRASKDWPRGQELLRAEQGGEGNSRFRPYSEPGKTLRQLGQPTQLNQHRDMGMKHSSFHRRHLTSGIGLRNRNRRQISWILFRPVLFLIGKYRQVSARFSARRIRRNFVRLFSGRQRPAELVVPFSARHDSSTESTSTIFSKTPSGQSLSTPFAFFFFGKTSFSFSTRHGPVEAFFFRDFQQDATAETFSAFSETQTCRICYSFSTQTCRILISDHFQQDTDSSTESTSTIFSKTLSRQSLSTPFAFFFRQDIVFFFSKTWTALSKPFVAIFSKMQPPKRFPPSARHRLVEFLHLFSTQTCRRFPIFSKTQTFRNPHSQFPARHCPAKTFPLGFSARHSTVEAFPF